MPPRPVTSSPSREATAPDEAAPPSFRVPRPGELVLTALLVETEAMIGTTHVKLFKGTTVGNIIRATRSVTWLDTAGPLIHEVEVEGGEILQVVLNPNQDPIAATQWVWDRV